MDECEAPKRKQGRQTKYTPAKAKEILRRLASGETLGICKSRLLLFISGPSTGMTLP